MSERGMRLGSPLTPGETLTVYVGRPALAVTAVWGDVRASMVDRGDLHWTCTVPEGIGGEPRFEVRRYPDPIVPVGGREEPG